MTIEKVACPTCFVSSNVELVELDAVCGSFVYIYKCSHCGGRWVVFEQPKENEDMNKEEKKINWDKPLRTVKNHYPIRVLCRDYKRNSDGISIVAIYTLINGMDVLIVSNERGKVSCSSIEIENIPEKQERWINVYLSLQGLQIHRTRKQADNIATIHRVARLKIEWEEGQFDE